MNANDELKNMQLMPGDRLPMSDKKTENHKAF